MRTWQASASNVMRLSDLPSILQLVHGRAEQGADPDVPTATPLCILAPHLGLAGRWLPSPHPHPAALPAASLKSAPGSSGQQPLSLLSLYVSGQVISL